MSKLRVALENIEVGNGYSVFEGLQEDGSVVIKLVADGETVHLLSLLPKETSIIADLPKVVSDELATPIELDSEERKIRHRKKEARETENS